MRTSQSPFPSLFLLSAGKTEIPEEPPQVLLLLRCQTKEDIVGTALKTVTSLNKESEWPFFLGDKSIWSVPSVSSLSDYSIWSS